MFIIRDATLEDARYIGRHLRKADIDELHDLHSPDGPEKAVVMSYQFSDRSFTVEIDGVPSIIGGIVCHVIGEDSVWALGSEESERHRSIWVRAGKRILPALMRSVGSTEAGNTCSVRNTRSIRWLKRLGFVFGPEYGGAVDFIIRLGGGECVSL